MPGWGGDRRPHRNSEGSSNAPGRTRQRKSAGQRRCNLGGGIHVQNPLRCEAQGWSMRSGDSGNGRGNNLWNMLGGAGRGIRHGGNCGWRRMARRGGWCVLPRSTCVGAVVQNWGARAQGRRCPELVKGAGRSSGTRLTNVHCSRARDAEQERTARAIHAAALRGRCDWLEKGGEGCPA